MFHLTILPLSLISLLPLPVATAHPLNLNTTTHLTTPSGAPGGGSNANPGSVYMCNGPDWTGSCTYLKNPLIGDKGGPPCIPIAPEWQHSIMSIGGDEGPECFSWQREGCVGIAMDITYPGVPNVKKIKLWRDWQGVAMSYRCQFGFYPEDPPPSL